MNVLPLKLTLPLSLVAPASELVTLDKRELFAVPAPQGRSITCRRGCLWLTFEGCATDVVLEAGDTHDCHDRGRLVVQALRAATVELR